MAKNDSDLFDRLRRAGVRKQVAKTLSGVGEDASKKVLRAGRSAVSELRALADEIEKRLPSVSTSTTTRRSSATRRTATARKAPARRAGSTTARRPASTRRRTTTTARAASATRAGATTAPRGQNKAKILESLKAGPQTASQIAGKTGIATGTVSSTLTKMAKAGEIVKADRGYRLPG